MSDGVSRMLERVPPQTLLWCLVGVALVYLILPYDILPDLLGLVGRVDDAVVIAWLVWFYRRHARQFMTGSAGHGASQEDAQPGAGRGGAQGGAHDGASADTRSAATPDPHAVLGVPRSASGEEIQAAYRARMREYHPDKVAHLGEDLQKLAHEKSQEIQRAYRTLRR
jgi:DnaJ like chaperone protein